MSLAPGTRFGPYEIRDAIGAGGMGEVYRAHDPRLGRDVAIKVLPESLAHDPERLTRFERESRLLASLSHPGIAALFGVEDVGSTRALVMELVEGPTLDQRIAAGPLPEDEALAIARQLAEAIEYAHEHGIIHRDLKPANVKLRPDGTVKMLDFGLARALDPQGAGTPADVTESPTMSARATGVGMILGTAAYMSPEQARGRDADRRADVWAFGVTLFELLTGRRAFSGETVTEVLAAVMRDDPSWTTLPPDLSPRWRPLLVRCLTKDPKRRLQSIGEARIALEDLAANPNDPEFAAAAARSSPRRAALLPWLVAAAAVITLAVLALRKPAPETAATEVSIVPVGGERVAEDLGYQPMAISPDGRSVAYTVRTGGELRLRLRRLDTREDVEIPGAAGARNLFFSRDGEWIGFFDSRRMYKVSVRGGTPVELTDALQDRLGTWLDDGTIVYTREITEPLYRIGESGGTPQAITALDSTRRERTHRFPCALDGGPWVVFTAQTIDSPGGYDDASIDAVSVTTGERRHLFKGARRAVWAPGGYLILARGNDLYAVPIDPKNPRIMQEPVPVLAGVGGEASAGASYFSIAAEGTIAWLPGGDPENIREVGWLDRNGRWTPTSIPPGPYLSLRISGDGTRALVDAGAGGGASDIWYADLRTGALNRLTHGGNSGSAVWLPDDLHFAFARGEPDGSNTIVVRRLDGAGGERVIATKPHPVTVSDITPDGRSVMFSDYGQRKGRLHLAATDGAAASRELAAEGEGYEQAGMVSPDGVWLAYVSNKTRREEVCLRRLDGSGGSWQISTGQGGGIRWGRGGRELFFVLSETLMRVTVDTRGDRLTVGQPEPLFEVPPSPTESAFRDYDYDPISDRMLFTRPPKGVADRREIALSLGWSKRLGEMVRANRR